MSALQLPALYVPAGLVALAALGCLGVQRFTIRPPRWLPAAALVLVLAALVVELVFGGQVRPLAGGWFGQDRFALFGQAALLLAALVVLALTDWVALGPLALAATLLALLGGMLAAAAADLGVLWGGVELSVLGSLVLLGLRDPGGARRLLPALAGLGAISALGLAAVAAATGSTSLAVVAAHLVQPLALPLAVALLLVVGSLVVQLGSSPWLGPLAAGAGGVALVKFVGAAALDGSAWAVLLPALAALAMLAGGLGAIAGGPARGIAGWAGLLQLGWILAGVAGGSRLSLGAALFLLGAYLVASAGAPLALGAAPHGLAGLADRGVARAAGFAVCVLSLAGVPPLAGFFGEFAIAAQLVRAGLFWLVALGLLGSALASFAVLRDLRLAFLATGGEAVVRAPATRWVAAGAGLAAALVIAYGFFANPISGLAVQGAAAVGLR